MLISQRRDEYEAIFDPKEYLYDYGYGTPDEEGLFLIRFLIEVLQRLPSDFLALEFGGGPALYSVAALAAKAREIHFCDYLKANLDEVRRWLDDQSDAFDWTPYIQLILEEEGKPITPQTISQWSAEIRRKVTWVTLCDALATAPLGQHHPQYDLVTAHYCTDVAVSTFSEWVQVIQNISTLVASNGWLVVSVTTGATTNTFYHSPDQNAFPCVDLSDEQIYRAYLASGYDPATFYLDKMLLPDEREYTGLTSAVARKK